MPRRKMAIYLAMKKYFTAPAALILLAVSLSGCVWWYPNHGYYGHGGYGHGGDYGHGGYDHGGYGH
jgi:hypothetical protein